MRARRRREFCWSRRSRSFLSGQKAGTGWSLVPPACAETLETATRGRSWWRSTAWVLYASVAPSRGSGCWTGPGTGSSSRWPLAPSARRRRGCLLLLVCFHLKSPRRVWSNWWKRCLQRIWSSPTSTRRRCGVAPVSVSDRVARRVPLRGVAAEMRRGRRAAASAFLPARRCAALPPLRVSPERGAAAVAGFLEHLILPVALLLANKRGARGFVFVIRLTRISSALQYLTPASLITR